MLFNVVGFVVIVEVVVLFNVVEFVKVVVLFNVVVDTMSSQSVLVVSVLV